MDKEKIFFEFIAAIHGLCVDDLGYFELVLQVDAKTPALREFLKTAFKIERERRPLLLEMKAN